MYNNILWFFINIIVSIFIIYIIHSLWLYLLDTYSTKKTKDIINTQVYKYKQIINELQENKLSVSPGSQSQSNIHDSELESMNDVLTKYMENEIS